MNRHFKRLTQGEPWYTQWQPLCLFAAPLSLPLPLEICSERCEENFPHYIDKSLALWPVSSIHECIPRKIFQTWHTKDLPPVLKRAGQRIRAENPDFEHYVYDSQECEQFIEKHFEPRVLEAYRKLLPLAYKADLWRFCVLYIYGGIYVDISFEAVNNFTFLEVIHKEHFSSEVSLYPYDDFPYKGVSIGFMVVNKGNERLISCINKIVNNIEREDYGQGIYDITSAVVLGSCFTEEEKKNLTQVRRVVRDSINGYSYNGTLILKRIPEYDRGLPGRSGQQYYQDWYNRTVFKKT
jgi:mannosyltransferase OCH1-like enzyme